MRVVLAALSTFLLVLFCLAPTGCSDRAETATFAADSTRVYPSKTPGGLDATITFCRKVSKRTGRPIGANTVFTIREKAKVRALVHLENVTAYGPGDLMFHLVWVGPNGKAFYKKRVDYTPDESATTLRGSISATPGKRYPGPHTLRVYLFRELIAEKSFELQLPPDVYNDG